jgi:hypothetical protein
MFRRILVAYEHLPCYAAPISEIKGAKERIRPRRRPRCA